MNRLDGKVALGTGAARGIGAQIARRMAEAGAVVVLSDLLEERGRETASEVTAVGVARFVKLDVTQEGDWEAAVSETVSGYGGLDILVNNAGVFLGRSLEAVSDLDWERIVSVNLKGVYLGTKLCASALRERSRAWMHGSSIVNLIIYRRACWIAARSALFDDQRRRNDLYQSHGCGLQWSRRSDSRQLNSSWCRGHRDGRADVCLPSRQMRKSNVEAVRQTTVSSYPIGRIGTPDDIAQGVIFLASDAAGFVTGTSMIVDGGFTAQ